MCLFPYTGNGKRKDKYVSRAQAFRRLRLLQEMSVCWKGSDVFHVSPIRKPMRVMSWTNRWITTKCVVKQLNRVPGRMTWEINSLTRASQKKAATLNLQSQRQVWVPLYDCSWSTDRLPFLSFTIENSHSSITLWWLPCQLQMHVLC